MIPHEIQVGGLTVPSGSGGECHPVALLSQCYLTKLIVIQTQGTSVAFSVNLYNRDDNCSDISIADADSHYLPKRLGKVVPTQTSDAEGYLEAFFPPPGYGFFSLDGGPGRAQQGQAIYLEIVPESTAEEDLEFAVSLGVSQ